MNSPSDTLHNRHTALVTGVCGFLGRYIARELRDHSWQVTGVDRFPMDPAQREHLGLHSHNILDLPTADIHNVILDVSPDVIVHAAGPASVPRSVEDPTADFRDSVSSLLCVLDGVRRAGVSSRVVFISSAAVYGNPSALPVSENAELAPISPYGSHKVMCENLIKDYARIYGMRGCSVRIFSAYGPPLRRQVLWDVTRQIVEERAVKLFGTGEETRDFVHARDVARGVRMAIDNSAFEGEAYNLATGQETSIRDLVGMVTDALGRTPEVQWSGTARVGDPNNWRANIGRIAALGFTPRVSIAEGVGEYVKWVEQTAAVAGMEEQCGSVS